jgi:anti-anti-sigma factor
MKKPEGFVKLPHILIFMGYANIISENLKYGENMKDENLVISKSAEEGVCKITAKGRVDSNSADSLLFALESALKEGQKTIILNMSQVEYLSSVGIRVILKIYKQAGESGGTFNIERPSEIVKNVLGMVALKEMLVTY